MAERTLKIVLGSAAVLGAMLLGYFAYSRPGYFTNQTYFAGLLILELLVAAVWAYRRFFFPLVIISFLLSGVNLPVGTGGWAVARWGFLGIGAAVGIIVSLKERTLNFGLFHVLALLSVTVTLVSASVSPYPTIALMKTVSLFLLFIYAGSGVRLAVIGRENRFFAGLLMGCEVFVGVIATLYLLGIEAMGNPNSLGAVMGVVAAPILLWGGMLNEKTSAHRRHLGLYAICIYLVMASHSRASIAAALLSFGLLTLGLRRYKLFVQSLCAVVILVASVAVLQPEAFSNYITSFTNDFVYKRGVGNDDVGILASRESRWQAATDSIRDHFWFGTGLGTEDMGAQANEHHRTFGSTSDIMMEHGSSYLAIASWVGMVGALPFLMLLLALLRSTLRAFTWVWRTGNAAHPAVPVALVVIAGLLHAGFEDWLLAPGYYLCVFFWSMAFILVDVSPVPQVASSRSSRSMAQGWAGITHAR